MTKVFEPKLDKHNIKNGIKERFDAYLPSLRAEMPGLLFEPPLGSKGLVDSECDVLYGRKLSIVPSNKIDISNSQNRHSCF